MERGSRIFENLRDRMVRSLEKMKDRAPKPKYLKFYDGQELVVIGRKFTIKIVDGAGSESGARFRDGIISIKTASDLSPTQQRMHVYELTRRMISKHALPDLYARVNDLNQAHFQFEFNKVRLRDQASRWGSYSKRTNSIYLNFRLLFAPPEVLDSVIVHELAHIKRQDHSREFWSIVLKAMPDYKERRKWLRKNGNGLGVLPMPAQQPLAAEDAIVQQPSKVI